MSNFVCVRFVTRNGITYDAYDYGYKCWPISGGYKTKRKRGDKTQQLKSKKNVLAKDST